MVDFGNFPCKTSSSDHINLPGCTYRIRCKGLINPKILILLYVLDNSKGLFHDFLNSIGSLCQVCQNTLKTTGKVILSLLAVELQVS